MLIENNMKYLKKYKLFENPNIMWDKTKEKYLDLNTKGTIVFSYYPVEGELEFFFQPDKYTITHWGLHDFYESEIDDDYIEDELPRGPKSGRLFTVQKIISFWDFPKNQKELKEVAKDIYDNIGIDIYGENYNIEILLDKNLIKKRTDKRDWFDWGDGWNGEDLDTIDFIPVKDYVGSEKRSKKELETPHLMDYKDKKKHLSKSKISKWKKFQKPFENKTDKL